jgi:8-oxo-dGTP pyrophosphatase MutT (NUDIX family)
MKIILSLRDEEYAPQRIREVREIARGLVSDGHGLYAVHHIVRQDLFGSYDYYETPGGGVDQGETPEMAVVRECREELGYSVRVLEELGFVDDFYNLIGRENHNHYYLCLRQGDFQGRHFVSSGDQMIKETLWLPLEKVIALYEGVPAGKLPNLVKARELPFWKEAAKRSQLALKALADSHGVE